MRKLLYIIIALIAVSSCKNVEYIDRVIVDSIQVPVPINNTKIEYRDRVLYDSIYVHDSIYTLIKGDTVIISKEKDRTRFIYKTDTITRIDSIQVPVTITKTRNVTETKIEEVNKLTWYQKVLNFIGIATLIAIIVFLIVKFK